MVNHPIPSDCRSSVAWRHLPGLPTASRHGWPSSSQSLRSSPSLPCAVDRVPADRMDAVDYANPVWCESATHTHVEYVFSQVGKLLCILNIYNNRNGTLMFSVFACWILQWILEMMCNCPAHSIQSTSTEKKAYQCLCSDIITLLWAFSTEDCTAVWTGH